MPDEIVANTAPVETAPQDTGVESEADVAAEEADLAQAAEAASTPAAKRAVESQMKKFRMRVFGKDVEEDIDMGNEEELTKRFQKAAAADVRMQEASRLRKEAEAFVDMLRKDPRKVLTNPHIGIDLRKLAEDIINEEVENSQKSPEQLEREKLQNELQELKDKYKLDEDNRKAHEFQRLQEATSQQLDTEITAALNEGGLPKKTYVVKRIADYLTVALQNDIKLSVKDVLPLVRREMKTDLKEFFSALPEDAIEEIMGAENITRVRKHNLSKIRKAAATASQIKPTGNGAKEASKEPSSEKKMTYRDFLKI